MRRRERELLGGIYDSVKTIGTLTPSNPMDLKAVAHNLPIATEGAKRIERAIECLGFGDFEDCAEHIKAADEILARRPKDTPCES